MTVPGWAWAAFAAFVIALLALDLFVLHRRAHEVSLKEAGIWSAVWVAMGLGFGGIVWAWLGGATAQAYLAGYLVEKSLSVDNVFVFAVIFSALAIPPRYQHRVLMLGVIGALITRGAFIMAGAALLDSLHEVSYLFGAVLLYAAVTTARGGSRREPGHDRVSRTLTRILPATSDLHGQRFLVRQNGRLLATPLLLAVIVVEITDVTFAVDSIPAVLAITTDTFVVYTSNVFALLGMRALYFLLAGAAGRFRYLGPGLAVILAGIAVKMLTADIYELPVWVSLAFIAVVLGTVAVLSLRGDHGNRDTRDSGETRDSGDTRDSSDTCDSGDNRAREARPAERRSAASAGPSRALGARQGRWGRISVRGGAEGGGRRIRGRGKGRRPPRPGVDHRAAAAASGSGHGSPAGSAGTGRGNSSQRTASCPPRRSRRRMRPGSASDWLVWAAAADRWMARAVAASAPRSISQPPGTPGRVRARSGTPPREQEATAARATAASPASPSPASGAMTSTRSGECRRIACLIRPAISASGYWCSFPSW